MNSVSGSVALNSARPRRRKADGWLASAASTSSAWARVSRLLNPARMTMPVGVAALSGRSPAASVQTSSRLDERAKIARHSPAPAALLASRCAFGGALRRTSNARTPDSTSAATLASFGPGARDRISVSENAGTPLPSRQSAGRRSSV